MHNGSATTPLRVLIVEDSKDDAFLLLRELRKGGYHVEHERVYSLDAFDAALSEQSWDLIISDYRLPGFCALDVLAATHERELDIPVLIVSGAIGEDIAVEAMHAGAHDYIMKDNLARLNPAVERELNEMEVHRRRKQAEAALRESEEHFRQLAGNIEGVLWLIDCTEQHMVFVSAAYEQIWEQPAEPLFESLESFLDTVHPEDYARVQARLEENGWEGFNEEYRIQRLDGTERWISTRSFPIRDETGQVYRIAGLSSDITGRKRLENEMKKLSRALDQTADAVLITDRDGIIDYVNPAFEKITGYSRAEVLGNRPTFLKSGMHDEAFYRQLWQNLLHGMPFNDIFINRRKNGDLYYEAKTITPVRDERGDVTHFVATGKDITDSLRQKKREERVILHDEVTGLANRTLLMDRLTQAVLQARRAKTLAAVYAIGFDLSELLGEGHEDSLGEQLLLSITQRLREAVRESDAIARLERDEFAIVQRDVHGRENIRDLAERISAAFTAPIPSEGYELFVVPRIGICVYPDDAEDAEALLAKAGIAMKNARSPGQGNYCFYERNMRTAPGKGEATRFLSN